VSRSAEEVAQSIAALLSKPEDRQRLRTAAGFRPPLPKGLHPVSVTGARGAGRLLAEISSPEEPTA